MKLFKTFFTAIAATLILAGTVMANPTEGAIGKAPEALTAAVAQVAETKTDIIQNGRTIVTTDFGGSLVEYITKFNRWRLEGRQIAVMDDCMSACTMMLGRIPADKICVSDNAQFAFHSAYTMTFAGPMFAKEATRLMWSYYPEPVRVKLREAGWTGGDVEHPDFIYIKATEFYELCQ